LTPGSSSADAPPLAGRKSVLFVIPSLKAGGSERVFSILLRHLDRRCFEPHLALFKAEGEYMEDLPKDVIIHDLQVSRARYALPRILRLARKLRPSAMLSTLSSVNLAVILCKPFLPKDTRVLVRQTVLTTAVLKDETRLHKLLYRYLYKRADKVICLSDSMADDLAVHFNVPREKLVRIYNPVDLKHVRQLAMAEGSPYSGPGPHLVTAGRLSREKGFDLLLAAMPSVLEHFPQTRLTLLGEGPLAAVLNAQSRQLGLSEVVDFPGFQHNPWRYFRHANLFVLPSRYEGLPNALLEALAVGTPVVATDCPGGLREIQACCKQIVLVPPEDPRALAEAIVKACNRTKTERESPKENLSSYDVDRVIEKYEKLLLS